MENICRNVETVLLSELNRKLNNFDQGSMYPKNPTGVKRIEGKVAKLANETPMIGLPARGEQELDRWPIRTPARMGEKRPASKLSTCAF